MSQPKSADQIQHDVEQELSATEYATLSLQPLFGGTANYIYRAKLKQPLVNSTAEALVKHGENYIAQNPAFALPRLRCVRSVARRAPLLGDDANRYEPNRK